MLNLLWDVLYEEVMDNVLVFVATAGNFATAKSYKGAWDDPTMAYIYVIQYEVLSRIKSRRNLLRRSFEKFRAFNSQKTRFYSGPE
jgi:hypothetical protein